MLLTKPTCPLSALGTLSQTLSNRRFPYPSHLVEDSPIPFGYVARDEHPSVTWEFVWFGVLLEPLMKLESITSWLKKP